MSGQLKEVRERIKSVKSTQQITKAMKMVSASKLRKAQQAIVQLRPYADKLNEILVHILTHLEGEADTEFAKDREVNSVAIAVITSNKGLCGAFNSNVIKEAVIRIEKDYRPLYEMGKLTILPIGKKANEYFRKHYPKANIITDHVLLINDLTYENVEAAATDLMEGFKKGEFDKVFVCYGRFRNAAMQIAESVQYLPVKRLELKGKGAKRKADYIFEPNKEDLLRELVPNILKTVFKKFVLDTHASEHGARMTAMDNATENAEDLLNELKINYNKARQEAITQELSEIVGGAAALGS
jgi:F-type H+-transporting ATPase subunit gamma